MKSLRSKTRVNREVNREAGRQNPSLSGSSKASAHLRCRRDSFEQVWRQTRGGLKTAGYANLPRRPVLAVVSSIVAKPACRKSRCGRRRRGPKIESDCKAE